MPVAKKESTKNIRAPIDHDHTQSMTEADKIRAATGRRKKLDTTFYERLPEYKDCQLFWAHNDGGDIESYLSIGAGLVRKVNQAKGGKVWEGFTNKEESEWVCVPGVASVDGRSIDAYLMYMTKDDYARYKTDPIKARQHEIEKAMGIGKVQGEEAKEAGKGAGLRTYAPNLPTGGQGLETEHDGHSVD